MTATIVDRFGKEIVTKKTLDDLPIMSCQAQRAKSITDKTLVKCGCQVFLVGVAFKLDKEGSINGQKGALFPQQMDVCSICGALNSKGVNEEANAFSEAIKKGDG